MTAHHTMRAELLQDQQITRWSCLSCDRVIEDRPDGLVLVCCGDKMASHRGGTIVPETEVEQSLQSNS